MNEGTLGLLTEIELRNLAGEIGLPLDDNPSVETLRLRIQRAAW